MTAEEIARLRDMYARHDGQTHFAKPKAVP